MKKSYKTLSITAMLLVIINLGIPVSVLSQGFEYRGAFNQKENG